MSSPAKAVLFLLVGTFAWWLTNSGLPVACPVLLRLMVPGLLLGLVEALSLDGVWRRIAAVLLAGIGSVAGIRLGQEMARPVLRGMSVSDPHFWQRSHLEDCILYGVFGLLLGLFLSLPRVSLLLTSQYALGGLLGGLGGLFLVQLVLLPSLHAVPILLLLGGGWGMTALGIGLLPALFRQTWLTSDSPLRREYFLVHKAVTFGSRSNADVHIPAGPQTAPVHAMIELLPGMGRRRLRHTAGGQGTHTFPPTLVNGRPVTGEQWLSDKDKIQIGPRAWTFHDRATRGALRLGPAVPEAWGKADRQETPSAPDGAGQTIAPRSGQRPLASGMENASSPAMPPQSDAARRSARDIGRVGTRLVCTEGPYAGRVYRLGPGETTVGSDPSCAVSLPADTEIASVQARLLSLPKGGHTLLNAGTDGVTQVNGQHLTAPIALLPGDRVQVGSTVLRYQ